MAPNLKNVPEQILNMDMCLLSDWNKYFEYPKINSFRQMIFHSQCSDKYDEIYKTTVKIGNRIYIKISSFSNIALLIT